MAMRKRNPRRPRRKILKRRKTKASASQYATIKETIEFKDLAPNQATSLVFNLSQFSRASALAANFRWYKAVKVEWAIEPLYNIYYDNTTGDTVPYLYKVMDRTQDTLGITLADIQGMGSKPTKLVNKKVFTFTPNWCSPGLTTYQVNESGFITGLNQQGLKAEYSYLASPNDSNMAPDVPQFMLPIDTRNPPPVNSGMNAVNTNQVTYNGMDIWIDQAVSQGNPLIARCTATVTWTFKDAKFSEFVRDPVQVVPKE